jgi:preprotein translocase subunit SecE
MKKKFEELVKYLKAVRSEVKRITWPSAQELKASTIVVIVTLVVVTFYLWMVDTIFARIFEKL